MAVAFKDYYETLGVAREASEDDIRRAYRKLARKYHPDVNKEPGAEDRFKEVSEAYEVLRDPEKRQRYDRLGANWRAGEDVSAASGFEDIFAQGFGDNVRVEFGDAGEFSDFFDSLFGSRRRTGGRAASSFQGFATRGSDHEASIELSLQEAAAGGRRRFTFSDGRSYEVNIPQGVQDGQRIRLAGEGGSGAGGGPSGDLFLRVHIKPHPRFRLEGRDLHVNVPVSPWEAALGATVPVPTVTGTAQVRVPAGSSSGRRLRLRGQGMPDGRGGHGDLYAELQIAVPSKLSDKERKGFEQLAKSSTFDPRKESR